TTEDGYYLPDGTVTGHVFEDTNNNGVQDAGEIDLAGVDVVITEADGTTQVVTTDADGNWTATVAAGTTTVDVDETTLPAGYE
ncbi:SdrD B-like domain-containing protein, partial [Croceibacter atlanticus]